MRTVCAVDLGASSGRVSRVDLDTLAVDTVHRFVTPVLRDGPSLRWDFEAIMREVRRGIAKAGVVASIGIDTWGVDYGLVDAGGVLVAPPFHYRDARTHGWRSLVDGIGADVLYEVTGLQLMPINTLFQLAVHDRDEIRRAARLLMMPELVVQQLTGCAAAERTSAGTTQLVDIRTGDWSADLIEAAGVPRRLFQPISSPGTRAGVYRDVPVHLVGGHDTASAVAAVPEAAAVFVSLGTWAIVGIRRAIPDTSRRARESNFSNERSVDGRYRFLKNVTGMWLLEELRRVWGSVDVAAAERLQGAGAILDVNDERFLAPADMEAEIRAAADLPGSRDRVVRCALDSIAHAIARVAREVAGFADARPPCVRIVGGGSQSKLIARLVSELTGFEVRTGPVEATTIGNALAQ